MPRVIVKLEGHYFEWSTLVDAPVTAPMTLDEFRDYYRGEYGRAAMRDYDHRMKRVETNGTSNYFEKSAEELMLHNRAGENERRLTIDELRAWAKGDYDEC